MCLVIDMRKTQRHQLAKDASPCNFIQVGADAEHAELVVVPAADAVAAFAAQHVDEVDRAEALPGAIDRRERFPRLPGRVPGLRRLKASVAVAAGAAVFAEIAEQAHAPARGRFAQSKQGIELRARNALELLARIRLLDQTALQHQVRQAVGHPRIGRQAVAARAAGLLVVALHALREIKVGYEPHVGLVDAHAERDCRHHHDALFALEPGLIRAACFGIHSRVVGHRVHSLPGQPRCRLIDLAARKAVDDARLAGVLLADESQELCARIDLVDDRVADVRPVETRDKNPRLLQGQPRSNLGAGLRIGSRRESDTRHVRKTLVQDGQLQVLRAEVVAPLRHAVRFVDREERDADSRKQVKAARRGEPLGSDVQHVQFACEQSALHRAGRAGILRGVEECCAHPRKRQGRDLILHQCDQRRHHHAGAFAQQRRNLEAQGFSAAGRHQHERVTACNHVPDDFFLGPAEARVSEGLAQDPQYRQRRATGHRFSCLSSSRNASAAKSRMFACRSAIPVSRVTAHSVCPATARQEWPAASP